MAASRTIPTTSSPPPVGGGAALDDIQVELTKLYDQSRLMCENEANIGNNYTADVLPALTGSLVDGMGFVFKAPATNTASSQMALNGGAAKTFVDRDGMTVKAGAIKQDGLYEFVYDASADKFVLTGVWYGMIGKRHMYIPKNRMRSRTTNGAAAGSTETATNKVMVETFDFDTTTQEHVQFDWVPPTSWDRGTLTARFVWLHGATTVNFGVAWGLQAVCFSNDDALEAAFGTGVEVTDTGGTTNDVYLSDETGAITPAGSPADLDLMILQAYRNPGHASDNLAVDAKLIGIILYWTEDDTSEV